MNNNWFLAQLLECQILDIEYLERILGICTQNNIEIDVTEVLSSYGSMHINNFISECFYKLAEGFLQAYKQSIEELLNIADLERYKEEHDMYETYVSYLDSYIWFQNEYIQNMYENSSYCL